MSVQALRNASDWLVDATRLEFDPSATVGGSFVAIDGSTPLTADWDAGNRNIFSRNAVNVLNVRAYGAGLGGGAVVDSAAIRQAISDAGSLGTVFFPIATYNVKPINVGDTEIFLLTKACRLVFQYGATILVDAATGANTDVFRYAPATNNDAFGMSVDGMFVIPQAGTPGRHAFVVDASTPPSQGIRGPNITNCIFQPLGGKSIVLSGVLGSNSIFTSFIQNNYITCGIGLVNVGDSCTIADNILTGSKFAVDGSLVSGANQLVIRNNNITATGGISITSFSESGPQIFYNNIELQAGSVFSGNNNAMVDLDGAPDIQALDFLGNNIHILSVGSNVDCLRLNNVNKAGIRGNKFIVPAGSKGIVTTANAANVYIAPDNFFTGAGTYLSLAQLTTSIVGHSTNTNVGFGTNAEPNTQVAVNAPFVAAASEPMVAMQNGSTTLAGIYGIRDNAGVAQGIEFWTFKLNIGQYLAGRIDNAGNWGLGTAGPTRILDVNGPQRLRGIATPAVSEANSGVMYFDSALNKYRVSMNGSAYVDLVGSGGVTGSGVAGKLAYWTGLTSLIEESNITLGGTYTLDVNGDINLALGKVIRVNAATVFKIDGVTGVVAVGGNNGPALGAVSTALGWGALALATGAGNTAVGSNAAPLVVTGVDNTAVGNASLPITTGDNNTAVGAGAGFSNTTGQHNVFLGGSSDVSAGNLINAVAIGYQAVVADNDCMSLGNASMHVGIRTSTPKTALDVGGSVAMRQLGLVLVNGLNSNIALTDTAWIRITGPGAVFSVGGFTLGTDGRVLTIRNTTAFQMTIVHMDASSAAANKIVTPTAGNVNCKVATLMYDTTEDVWVLVNYH